MWRFLFFFHLVVLETERTHTRFFGYHKVLHQLEEFSTSWWVGSSEACFYHHYYFLFVLVIMHLVYSWLNSSPYDLENCISYLHMHVLMHMTICASMHSCIHTWDLDLQSACILYGGPYFWVLQIRWAGLPDIVIAERYFKHQYYTLHYFNYEGIRVFFSVTSIRIPQSANGITQTESSRWKYVEEFVTLSNADESYFGTTTYVKAYFILKAH